MGDLGGDTPFPAFTYLNAAFIIGAIFTYVVNVFLDVVVAATYLYDGYHWYSLATVLMVLLPTAVIQVFSVRWHQMDLQPPDVAVTPKLWAVHGTLLGVVHRYMVVLSLGLEAMKSKDPADYRRFFQQHSDACMLRLFDSFTNAAPLLVFHLYVIVGRASWPADQVAWPAIAALASTVSLGWGIAAYSNSLRTMAAAVPGTGTAGLWWRTAGTAFQTLWRLGMISARLVSLVMLALGLRHWALLVVFVHWAGMTGWVVSQDTDFCATKWEERLYNAVVGVIYCFAFFDLKEGSRSRFRALFFYAVVVAENYGFLFVFAYLWDGGDGNIDGGADPDVRKWFSVGAFALVTAGTVVGVTSMLTYYRFFHPSGPIRLCTGESVEFKNDLLGFITTNPDKGGRNPTKTTPDYVIEFEESTLMKAPSPTTDEQLQLPPPPRPPKGHEVLRHSRSFKNSCHVGNRHQQRGQLPRGGLDDHDGGRWTRYRTGCEERLESGSIRSVSPIAGPPESQGVVRADDDVDHDYDDHQHHHLPEEDHHRHGIMASMVQMAMHQERLDSAYCTDSNRTVSRSTASPPQASGGAGTAFPCQHNSTMVKDSSLQDEDRHHDDSAAAAAAAFNNETYSSTAAAAAGGVVANNNNNTYQSVLGVEHLQGGARRPDHQDAPAEKLLKRSPVVKDVVTTGFAQISQIVQRKGQTPGSGGGAREGLNPPLTIIIPNISHQALARSSAGLGGGAPNRHSTREDSEKTINLEELNPSRVPRGAQQHLQQHQQQQQRWSHHDYENLALININRNPSGAVRHWRAYSDVAGNQHDDSVPHQHPEDSVSSSSSAGSSRKSGQGGPPPPRLSAALLSGRTRGSGAARNSFNATGAADYSSLHYFDIYPLSRELKEQLYRSITPLSTAATVASDTGTNDSDTYEPIETYSILPPADAASGPPVLSGGANRRPEEVGHVEGPHHGGSRSSSSSRSTGADPQVPVTLIHHDGKQVSTRQIVSMDSLREVLNRHVKVPMDEERGDLYILAPVRMILSPIHEELETLAGAGGEDNHNTTAASSSSTMAVSKDHDYDFNRSVMTVISEILSNHSKNVTLHQSLSATTTAKVPQDMDPDGRFQDSIDSASSTLVHTIEEIRNQSLCNLYQHYLSSSSFGDLEVLSSTTSSVATAIAVASTSSAGAAPQVPPKNHFVPIRKEMVAEEEDPSAASGARPEPDEPRSREKSPVRSIKSNTLVPSPKVNVMVAPVAEDRLYTSVGSRKNLLELAGNRNILNTPLMRDEPPDGRLFSVRAENPLLENQDEKLAAKIKATLSSDSESDDGESRPATQQAGRGLASAASAATTTTTMETPAGQKGLSRCSVVLSPSSKYGYGDDDGTTPTPPLRANQFVRNISRPRRLLSNNNSRAAEPDVVGGTGGRGSRKRHSAAGTTMMISAGSRDDLYQNISDDFLMLRNSVRDKNGRPVDCRSGPKALVEPPSVATRGVWTTASFQKPEIAGGRRQQEARNSNYRRSMSVLECVAAGAGKENLDPKGLHQEGQRRRGRPVVAPLSHPPPSYLSRLPEKPAHLRRPAPGPVPAATGSATPPWSQGGGGGPYVINTSSLCSTSSSTSLPQHQRLPSSYPSSSRHRLI